MNTKSYEHNRYIINRITLYNEVSNSHYPDNFLGYVNEINSPRLKSTEEALQIFATYPYLTEFLNKLKEANIDILLAGSTTLSALIKDITFLPNDYDFYLKDISQEKLIKIEDILQSIFTNHNMIVCRNVLTMTWIFENEINEEINIDYDVSQKNIHKIQINLLRTDSWAQTMVSYHSDLTCVGYEVLTGQFIYLKKRFDTDIDKDIHYFSDIINLDTSVSLDRAVQKYQKRGFNSKSIIVMGSNTINADALHFEFSGPNKMAMGEEEDDGEDQDEMNSLIEYIEKYYMYTKDIVFANSCQQLFPDQKIPHILDIWKLKEDPEFKEFIEQPNKIIQTNGVYFEETDAYETILCRCITCKNRLSVKSYFAKLQENEKLCSCEDQDIEYDYLIIIKNKTICKNNIVIQI
jgi:hypothetical protein